MWSGGPTAWLSRPVWPINVKVVKNTFFICINIFIIVIVIIAILNPSSNCSSKDLQVKWQDYYVELYSITHVSKPLHICKCVMSLLRKYFHLSVCSSDPALKRMKIHLLQGCVFRYFFKKKKTLIKIQKNLINNSAAGSKGSGNRSHTGASTGGLDLLSRGVTDSRRRKYQV